MFLLSGQISKARNMIAAISDASTVVGLMANFAANTPRGFVSLMKADGHGEIQGAATSRDNFPQNSARDTRSRPTQYRVVESFHKLTVVCCSAAQDMKHNVQWCLVLDSYESFG